MGSTTTHQKSFLIRKVIFLAASLIATGIVMRFFSPPHKLDSRIFYTVKEAIEYLTGLSELQKRDYFFAEIFDFWFMINYTWINFIVAKNVNVSRRLIWIAFAPGLLDLFETILIASFLHYRVFSTAHELLPILSSLKWISVIALIIYLILAGLKHRANR